jgi:hypothetical protein
LLCFLATITRITTLIKSSIPTEISAFVLVNFIILSEDKNHISMPAPESPIAFEKIKPPSWKRPKISPATG